MVKIVFFAILLSLFSMADSVNVDSKESVESNVDSKNATETNAESKDVDFKNLESKNAQSGMITDEDFITAKEYGKYLYENPRGISCKSCHGEYGEGGTLASYAHRDKPKELIAPSITNVSFEGFKNALQKSKGVMPKYYLTEQETQAIYDYIKN